MALDRDIVDGIYAAALDETQWPSAVQGIGTALNAQSVALLLADENLVARNLSLAAGVIDQQWVRDAYRNYFGKVDPAVALFANMPIGQATTTSMAWSPRTIYRDEFYNDFYAHLTLRDAMGAPLLRKDGRTAFLSAHRDKDSALFDRAELELFGHYMGHLRKALTIHCELSHLRRRAETLEALFDRMNLGAALTDGAGRVQYLNRAAQLILARNDGLTQSGGVLVARHRDTAVKLAKLIAAAACDNGLGGGHGTASVPRGDGEKDYAVLAVPHRPLPQARDLFALAEAKAASNGNAVLLLIRNPDDNSQSGFAALRRRFALTGSETELLQALAFGESLADYCARRSISVNTGKFHLRHLFAKTETANQAALVRVTVQLLGNFAPFSYH